MLRASASLFVFSWILVGCATHPIEKQIRKQRLYPYPQFVDQSKLGDVVMITGGDMVPVIGPTNECALFTTEGAKKALTSPVYNNIAKGKLGVRSNLVGRLFSDLETPSFSISGENIVKVKFVNPTLAEYDFLEVQARLENLSQSCKDRLKNLDNLHVIFREMYTESIEYTATTAIKSYMGESEQELPADDKILDADGNVLYFFRGNTIEDPKPFRVAYQVLEVDGIFQNKIKIRAIVPEEYSKYGVGAVAPN